LPMATSSTLYFSHSAATATAALAADLAGEQAVLRFAEYQFAVAANLSRELQAWQPAEAPGEWKMIISNYAETTPRPTGSVVPDGRRRDSQTSAP
ncbi:hypothetical protein FK514_29385, partial [Klebsiella pneumoniae]|uniref:hypothetical protein n=1 Tax=Klebsiella pneumoniae TaxID=573 RepID=UPI00210EBD9A